MNAKIGCVIVTFNRLDKLKKALATYDNQTYKPEYILVVDNASTDGTNEFLKDWKNNSSAQNHYVTTLEKNNGGSGGFYEGQKRALEMSADWIMISDDDGYPEENYLEGIANYINNNDCSKISILVGSLWEHGSNINGHRAIYKKHFWGNSFVRPAITNELKQYNGVYCIDSVSYVGPVINKEAIEKAGLCNPNFFIWFDDFEHVYRLNKYGVIGYMPQYKIIHDTEMVSNTLSWKDYYGIRNKLYFLKKHRYSSYILMIIILTLKTVLCPLKGKKAREVKMRFIAIKDAVKGKMGMHEVYKPGWKSY